MIRAGFVFGLLCLSLGLGGASAVAADESNEKGFMPLFDGKTLDGWKKVGGGATYRVEDGMIVGEVGPGANTFLRTDRTYGDFVLKLDFKLDVPGNSGIQFRSHQQNGDGRVFGYQYEIDPSARAWTAGIYDEGRRGWLYPLQGHPEAQKAFDLTGWNAVVIEARGPRLRTTLNGVPCADLLDTADLEGFLALQVHAGKAGQIRWKNIRLKDMGEKHWARLWDGATLDGWKKIGGGTWTIEDGALHGTSPASEPKHGLLITERDHTNFAVRLKFLDKKGNSGLYFRCNEGGDAGVVGFQAEIDEGKETGGLYETGGRGWVVQPTEKEVKSWYKPGTWNELSVVALGGRLVVHVNGKKSAEFRDPKDLHEGQIALQLHGGQEMDVWFKDIGILVLNEPPPVDK